MLLKKMCIDYIKLALGNSIYLFESKLYTLFIIGLNMNKRRVNLWQSYTVAKVLSANSDRLTCIVLVLQFCINIFVPDPCTTNSPIWTLFVRGEHQKTLYPFLPPLSKVPNSEPQSGYSVGQRFLMISIFLITKLVSLISSLPLKSIH